MDEKHTEKINRQVEEHHQKVEANQRRLRSELKPHYDFIVCGSGAAGSVVAGRLAETVDATVLLIEAGGSDDTPNVMEIDQWRFNLGTERNWGFKDQSNPHLNGRVISLGSGKVLGGSSSINVMIWSRGHRNDWNFFAEEAGGSEWNYDAVLNLYRKIEDWRGPADPQYRGTGGPVCVQPMPDPNPIAPAMVEGARSVGIPCFESPNGRMMEEDGGASLIDLWARDGKRESIFRSYVFPHMAKPNLTVLTGATVAKIILEGNQATGVEVLHGGKMRRIGAKHEVILSLGALQTPKVLMLSGIGDENQLQAFHLPTVQHLPGVGQNFQDHVGLGCVWEYAEPLAPRNNSVEATFFWKSDSTLDTPDIQVCQTEAVSCTPDNARKYQPPPGSWSMLGGIVKPKSRGQIRLTGDQFDDPLSINANMLSHPDDVKAAIACVGLCREIGNSPALRSFTRREVMPGNAKGAELVNFIRDAAMTYWHYAGTARMGQDSMAVVDGQLRVHGIERLRVADASIMPRVTTGNTMASCVVIGERAASLLKQTHGLAAGLLRSSSL